MGYDKKEEKMEEITRERIIIIGFLLLAALAWFFYSIMNNELYFEGETYTHTLEEIAQIKNANELLHDEILEASSLTSIAELAYKDGFVRATYIYLR